MSRDFRIWDRRFWSLRKFDPVSDISQIM